MCHLAGTMGTLSIHRPLGSVWNGYDVSEEGIYCRRRIALTAGAQHRQCLGNFIARLHHPRITDPAHRNAILSLLYLAKFVIPYPPGFPIMVPGQVITQETIEFMRKLDVKEIHGYQAALGLQLIKPDKLSSRRKKPGANGKKNGAVQRRTTARKKA